MGERGISRIFSQLALRDAGIEKLPDSGQPLVEQPLVDFANNRTVTGCRRDLRKPRSHKSTTQNANSANNHAGILAGHSWSRCPNAPPNQRFVGRHVADYVQVVTFAAQNLRPYRETLENSADP